MRTAIGSDEGQHWQRSNSISDETSEHRSHKLTSIHHSDKLTSIHHSDAKSQRSPLGRRSGVDSRSDYKGVHSRGILQHETLPIDAHCSSIIHPRIKSTMSTALCKFQSPLIATEMSDRTASGGINCSLKIRHVDERHIPRTNISSHHGKLPNSSSHVSKSSVIGPDCPEKAYSVGVSQCWDDEAGAVYYYHHDSGEASWLPPEL